MHLMLLMLLLLANMRELAGIRLGVLDGLELRSRRVKLRLVKVRGRLCKSTRVLHVELLLRLLLLESLRSLVLDEGRLRGERTERAWWDLSLVEAQVEVLVLVLVWCWCWRLVPSHVLRDRKRSFSSS